MSVIIVLCVYSSNNLHIYHFLQFELRLYIITFYQLEILALHQRNDINIEEYFLIMMYSLDWPMNQDFGQNPWDIPRET